MNQPPHRRGLRANHHFQRRRDRRRRALWFERLEDRRLLAGFVVNSTGNDFDSYGDDGICDTANDPTTDPPTPPSEVCTLAAAIQQANFSAGLDRIEFAIPGTGVPIIQLGTRGSVDDKVTIDGTTQSAGRVELRGNGEANLTGTGLTFSVNSGGSTVRGLVLNDWGNSGMQFFSDNNLIVGNFIGTNSTGTATLGNSVGLAIHGNNNTIGGTTEADRNVISGNTGPGLNIAVPFLGGSTTGNRVIGNFIGTDVTGSVALGNGSSGVFIAFGQSNTIGGAAPGEGNVISANGLVIPSSGGISIAGNTATGNLVLGNRIGTNAAGTAPLGNRIGVLINDAPDNFIGGLPAGSSNIVGNVISGNTTFGVQIVNANATGNVVQGNLIGTDVTGTIADPDGLPNSGDELGNRFDGVFLDAAVSQTVIGGLTPDARNVISGNLGDGVLINGSLGLPAKDNVIIGNWIGTNIAGTAALPNRARGIHIDQHAEFNIVGGTTAGERNVISGNRLDGVIIALQTATGNRIIGNYIGVQPDGSTRLSNEQSGVYVLRAVANEIGGSATGEGNVISANGQVGVLIQGDEARDNVVLGNFIGTDFSGLLNDPDGMPDSGDELGNFAAGVHIHDAPENRIGVPLESSGTPAGNVIAGNDDGVFIGGVSATGNLVGANIIGLDRSGTQSRFGNNSAGVSIFGASKNIIGGVAPDGTVVPGNTISGNKYGVRITNDSGTVATQNVVSRNLIGTDTVGVPRITGTSLGNRTAGVSILHAAGNFIGQATGADEQCDTVAKPGNVIAGNLKVGVLIEGDTATGNSVRCNSIFANSGIGIDLGGDGVTDLGGDGVTQNDPLDPDSGPNKLQNYPILSVVEVNASDGTIIGGTLTGPSGRSYRLDFYATDVSQARSLKDGFQGQLYIGTHVVTIGATGSVHFKTPAGAVAGKLPGETVTATATDSAGNTSEFSPFSSDFVAGGQQVRIPVVFVPGFFASFPAPTSIGGMDASYVPYLTTLGIQPTQLVADPVLRAYDDIIQTLINNGYERGRDLFVATHDWRLPVGPSSLNQSTWDGRIEGVTGSSISDETFEYGLDYLGNWLKLAAEQWYLRYRQPLTHVQLMGHSMGGLVSRGYIQSTAYGDTYPSGVAGRDLRLPTVGNFTMLAVPNQGASLVYNAWENNFVGNSSYRLVLSKMVNHAWRKMLNGRTIDGGFLHTIDPAEFPTLFQANPSAEDVRADQRKFLRLYTKGLANLLPTYDFVVPNQVGVEFEPDAASVNSLLMDLNQTTLFADRVSRPMAMYGTNVRTATGTTIQAGPAEQPLFSLIEPKVIVPFPDILGRNADPFEIWYRDVFSDNAGDGTVPLQSLENLFLGDARLELFPFCNPLSGGCRPNDLPTPGRIGAPGRVNHTSLTGNFDVQELILSQLGHPPESDSDISTGSEVTALDDQLLDIVTPFVVYSYTSDPPRDSLLVNDGDQRLGFSVATGALREIPGSIWFGNADGIGWVFDDAGGPVRLELVGNGEEYFVQVTGFGPGGDFGIESSGFLAAGETKNLDVGGPPPFVAPVITSTSIVVGPDAGNESRVRVFDNLGQTERLNFAPYGVNFASGVRVATGNLSGDKTPDIITVASSSAGGHVKVFSGQTGAELGNFFAFPGFTGGVSVASGDIDSDGFDDILVGAGAGAPGEQVKVFSGRTGAELRSFLAFPGFSGGVTVAAGDFNADGFDDIIVGAGAGAPGEQVKVFSGQTGAEIRSFFAFAGFLGGVTVAGGDVNSDGFDDIVVGAGSGAAGGHVKVFDGSTSGELQSFFAYPGFTGGVQVATGDFNNDGTPDIITGPGSGAGPQVKVFDGNTLATLDSFFAYDTNFTGGVFVSGVASPPVTVVPLPPGGGMFELLENNGDIVVRQQGGAEVFRGPQADNPRLRINGPPNVNDVLIVNLNGLTTSITFDGGEGGSDALRLDGIVSRPFLKHQFLGPIDGLVILDPGVAPSLVKFLNLRYLGLEPIEDNLMVVDRVFTFPDSDDNILLNTGDSAADSILRIDSNNSEVVDFQQPTGSLTIESATNDTANIGLGWLFDDTEVVDGKFVRIFARDGLTLRMIGPHDWSNPVNPLDVNANGSVEPLDVLIIINELNAPKFRDAAGRLVDAASLALFPDFYFDTNRDGFLVPLDALVIINFLNSFNGGLEGEDTLPARSGPFDPAFADLTAFIPRTESRPNVVTRVSREEGTVAIARPALPTSRQSSPAPRQLTSAEYARGLDELLADLEADTLLDELGS